MQEEDYRTSIGTQIGSVTSHFVTVYTHSSGGITLVSHDRRTLPVALALIEHLNLTEDTAAAVTWSFLDDLEKEQQQHV